MLKKDFPIFKNNPGLVYLDSAATLQKPAHVIDGISTYLQHDYANIHRGWYTLSETSEAVYWQARKKVAELVGGKDDEVIFTANATDSVNKLVRSLMFTGILLRGDTVLLTRLEHHANIVPRQIAAKEYGIVLEFVILDDEQQIDGVDLEKKLHDRVKVFSCTMVSNVTGGITHMKAIKKILDQQETKPLWFVDASQAVPHLHIDVTSLGVDALYFTGHKLGAITGIGVLWGRKELLEGLKPARGGGGMVEEVTMDGYTVQGAPDKFEPGTPNLVGAISLLLAIEYIESIGDGGLQGGYTQLDMIEKPLMKYCFEQFKLLENNDIRLLGPTDLEKKIGVFSFQLPVGKNATQLGQFMATKNICIRCGAQCAHIFHAGLEDTIGGKSCVQQTCRISLWGYNDVAELAIFFSALRTFLN